MLMYDVINRKKNGCELTDEEIGFVVDGFTDGSIPDYQMSAWLMAVYFEGMSERETACLTDCMAHSGDMADLSAIGSIKVDKHSTGGVGDKTTLICGPIVASFGVPVAKMSGRGLGHTGGTLDKLEAIPGFRVDLDREEFTRIVNDVGICVIGQTGNIVPADKKIYALRDVTATVDSLPLIASSIMSKKLAGGADAIVLDVKTGSGALMRTLEESIELAESMVAIGKNTGREMAALVTNMDVPLGAAVGNSLEIAEAVRTLKGGGPEDLTMVGVELAANMLCLAKKGTIQECRDMARGAIVDGSAYAKLEEMVARQGGDIAVLREPELLPQAAYVGEVTSAQDGYVTAMDTQKIGMISVSLGAGRARKEDIIDYGAGIEMLKKTGDAVRQGDVIARLHTDGQPRARQAAEAFAEAYTVGEEQPCAEKLFFARITPDAVRML